MLPLVGALLIPPLSNPHRRWPVEPTVGWEDRNSTPGWGDVKSLTAKTPSTRDNAITRSCASKNGALACAGAIALKPGTSWAILE